MLLLLLKLILVPCLIAGVTLAARRWGLRVGGLLTALPTVAGPTLCFYAVEQGQQFASGAARATLFGLVAVGAFSVVYAHCATRWTWPVSLLAGWGAFGIVTLAIYRVHLGLAVTLAVTVLSLLISRSLLPSISSRPSPVTPPRWDVPLRMLSAVALVVVLTSAADRLGPNLAGVLTPFPIATAIVAGFTHAQHGASAVARFFKGFLPGLCSFAVFCFLLAALLPLWPVAAALLAALGGQLVLQMVLLWRVTALAIDSR
ncbi:MAG: hypothetical protein AB7I50_02520 [Vicinamibacterales bacterium]